MSTSALNPVVNSTMEANAPTPCNISARFIQEMSYGWTYGEEQELFVGIMFHLEHLAVKNATQFQDLIVQVSLFLTCTLQNKSKVELIRWKLRHMCDMYRHFKRFLFEVPGVSFNLQTNKAKVGPKYWRCIGQESELYAYFRTYGFSQYKNCWKVFDKNGLDQYASYIDESVHQNIPIGLDPRFLNGFYYFRSRARYPLPNKSQRALHYKDCKVNTDDLDLYFFTNGWEITDEGDFMIKIESLVKDRTVNSQEKFDILVDDLVQFYYDPEDIQATEAGIHEKIRSVAYVYQLFKRFLFETAGVEYNFYDWGARVNDSYWECEGQEPHYKAFFRTDGYVMYQTCYNVFEVKGLERFAHGKHPIDLIIPVGADVTAMADEDVFKSYYRS